MACQITEYPSQAEHEMAWKKLAKSIVDLSLAVPTGKKGELTILGSGIETLGFIANDIPLIEAADVVFYCVADPGTVTWIKTLRPDAYDLYVLYGDEKVRYTTYMQMTEAMLSPVRQGQKVVAIYYGHPGIFALSPHRAILLARREGHKAIMRPGISALDCLCADLGIDPAHPGLQTYEATDMLIRHRIPDDHLHLVLWQVGLIGEMGFRHQGYLNQKFVVLLEYLQNYYGEEYAIVHYIASRYPTIPPIIESYTLQALYDPKKQLKITGISTFYIPPKQVAPADLVMLKRLDLLKGKKKPIKLRQNSPLREIGQYGPRERKAFTAFKRFAIPRSYHWQKNTVASRFLIALTKDHSLQEKFRSEPLTAFSEFPDLTSQERYLLASREANNIQVAAKGLLNHSVENEKFLNDLFFKNKLFSEIAQTLQTEPLLALIDKLGKKYGLDWSSLQKNVERLFRLRLSLWSGIYFSSDQDCLITIQGGVLCLEQILRVNGQSIKQFTFVNGLIEWGKQEGIDFSGCLRFDINHRGQRSLIGAFYQSDKQESTHFFRLPELQISENSLYVLVGRYRRQTESNTSSILEIKPIFCASGFRKIVVLLDGTLQMEPIYYDSSRSILYIGRKAFPLAINGKNLQQGWIPVIELNSGYSGLYELTIPAIHNLSHNLNIESNHITLNKTKILPKKISLKSIVWKKQSTVLADGILTFYLNPINLLPYCLGKVKTSSGEMQPCYGRFSMPEQTELSIDYHALFDISPLAWRILTEQCAQFTAQDSFLFWIHPLKIGNSIKMLYWLLNKLSTRDK
jgi:Tetrapyrrole (Corrin/Porphyrin) Methylases